MRIALFVVPLVVGCAKDTSPTWHQDIAPLVAENCGSCHTEGGIAPFAFDTYEQADLQAPAMLAAIDAGTMPPFLAQETEDCAPERPWKDDMRLSDEEIALFSAWMEADRPEGDPETAAELPSSPSLAIDSPDVVMNFRQPFTVEGDQDLFQCFVLDPGNTDTMMWVDAIQLVPGNDRVDHHGLVFLDVNGESEALAGPDGSFPCFNNPDVAGTLLATWVPGALPMRTPETAAMPMPPGARIVVQMHYHPVPGQAETDQSSVQLTWSETEPEWAAAQVLLGNDWRQNDDGSGLQPGPNDETSTPEFSIPAGVSDHTETMIYEQTIALDIPLFSVGTHMHYVGTDMTIQLRPGGSEADQECLVGTPDWNFNWQRTYDFDVPIDEMPVIGQGDQLHMTCTFDNTTDNPYVAAALADQGLTEPTDVSLGEETLDEMCLGLFGILVPPALVANLY